MLSKDTNRSLATEVQLRNAQLFGQNTSLGMTNGKVGFTSTSICSASKPNPGGFAPKSIVAP